MPQTTKYITVQGDTWDSIAYRLWGEERLFMALKLANPAYLDTVIFAPGVVLAVPARPVETSAQELPPWRTLKPQF